MDQTRTSLLAAFTAGALLMARGTATGPAPPVASGAPAAAPAAAGKALGVELTAPRERR
jgi:hypothetical protein